MSSKWYTPQPTTADNKPRRVGVEIEFTGLSLQDVAQIAGRWAGQPPSMHSLAEGSVATQWGKLGVEIDWLYLKKLSEEQNIDPQSHRWLELLRDLAKVIVPTEIVCPPIPIDELDEVERLINFLRDAGAKGTGHSPLASYGVHLNPEMPDLQAETIARYLKAFGLLQWWLMDVCDVNLTRKLYPFVDLYPEAYVLACLEYDADISRGQIQQDYLEYNPTRNRALDLWPLLCHLDENWVRTHNDDEHVKPRPTLHYRLPNCEIDKPEWSLHECWRPWQQVEQLAHEPEQIAYLSEQFIDQQRPFLGAHRNQWVQFISSWLHDPTSA